MSDLVTFLAARLDEGEATVRYCSPAPWRSSPRGIYVDDANGKRLAHVLMTDDGQHIARHDPARVLREVEADRKLLAAYDEAVNGPAADLGVADALEAVIRDRAAVHSDHPDYQQEWKP